MTIQFEKTIFPKPFYFMVFNIIPAEGSNLGLIKNLFTNDQDGLKHFFETQRGIRFGGWDLAIHGGYKISLWGIENENKARRVQVLDTGALIIQGALTSDFLCWGDDDLGYKIKHLGLIEFTLNAVIALKRMMKDVKEPKFVEYTIGFAGMEKDKYYLPQIGPYNMEVGKNYPTGTDYEFSGTLRKEEFSGDESRITYGIIEKLYRIFGLNSSSIPFTTTDSSGNTLIDVEKIKKA